MFMQMKSRQTYRRSRPRTDEEIRRAFRRDLTACLLAALAFVVIFVVLMLFHPS